MVFRSVTRGHVIRAGSLAASAAVVVLAVAGCASKPVQYATPNSSPSASSSASALDTAPASPAPSQSPLPAASGQLTGTQLETVLLPQSSFPAGFSLSSGSAVDSGGSVTATPAAVSLATMSCSDFVSTLGNTGFGESAMAGNSFTYSSGNQAFDQVVYQFPSAAAAKAFVSGVTSLAGRCGSFTATASGQKGTFSLKAASAAPVGGHSALRLTQSGTINGTSATLGTLLTASGPDVFTVSAVGLGSPAPTNPATATLAYDLMKRQAAAATLG
jgi:hypothetical protein